MGTFKLNDRVKGQTEFGEEFARIVKILCGGSLVIAQWESDGSKTLPTEPERFQAA